MFQHSCSRGRCQLAVRVESIHVWGLDKLSVITHPASGLMTMMTRYVRKGPLGCAIRLQTQPPADQKKQGDQEHAECSHRRCSQMD